jgi:hypothetical protein
MPDQLAGSGPLSLWPFRFLQKQQQQHQQQQQGFKSPTSVAQPATCACQVELHTAFQDSHEKTVKQADLECGKDSATTLAACAMQRAFLLKSSWC